MKRTLTNRGFALINFEDTKGNKCSIQKSSLVDDDYMWLGISKPSHSIMVSDASKVGIDISNRTGEELHGWMDYPIPDEVFVDSRMHLNKQQAKELVKVLKVFIRKGEL